MADANIKYKISQVGAEKVAASFKTIGTSIASSFGGVLALAGIVRITKSLKDAARDGVETRQKFDVVFSELEAGAGRVADAFSREFKLAGVTTRDLLGGVGDLLVGFGFNEQAALDMSVQVNRLAQDLASFSNFSGGAKGASDALTKALVGETESVKALGIVIRQTTPEFIRNVQAIQDTQGVTLLQAKAIEILRIAYEQSGKAIGDFTRTQESLANQERILDERLKDLSESLGQDLTGGFNDATGAALEAVEAFNDFNKTIKELSGNFGESVGIIGLWVKAVTFIPKNVTLPLLTGDAFTVKFWTEVLGLGGTEGRGGSLGRDMIDTLKRGAGIGGKGFEKLSDEVDKVRKRLSQVKNLIAGQGLSFERLNELQTERNKLEAQLKLKAEETLSVRVAETDALLLQFKTAKEYVDYLTRTPIVTGTKDIKRGGAYWESRNMMGQVFGPKNKTALKDADKMGQTIFDNWSNILVSNMNSSWVTIFSDANALFEQLINSMVNLLLGNVFSGLISLAGGGGLTGILGAIFSAPVSGGGDTTHLTIEMGGMPLGQVVLEGNRQISQRRLT